MPAVAMAGLRRPQRRPRQRRRPCRRPQRLTLAAGALATLAEQRLVMFVSATVAQFFAAAPAGAMWPSSLLAGSTGPGTDGGAATLWRA
ncbi:MAG: hypothetical protein U1F67_01810 [Rubrivivax sp.]